MSDDPPFANIFTIDGLPVYFLENQTQTATMMEYLSSEKNVAIDQERAPYNKFYFQKPTLLQLATSKNIFLIDLLKDKEILNPLKPLFIDSTITKVFFDAPWDLYYFKEYFNLIIKGIFDIQIAATLLYPRKGTIGLEELVTKELEKLDYNKSKKQQKSDWTVRPLSKSQLQYASKEIASFLALSSKLREKKRLKKMLIFLEYAHQRLIKETPSQEYDPFSVRRIPGFHELSSAQKHLVFRLGEVRDKIARKRNRPSFFILTNKQLIQLTKPRIKIQSVFTQRQKFSKHDLGLIQQAITEPIPDRTFENSVQSLSFTNLPLLQQKLLIWRNNISKVIGVPKRFILSKKEINSFDFSSKKKVLNGIWFTSKSDPKAAELTESMNKALEHIYSDKIKL
ncbi:MAG: HRDC domain-containing protein [Candidatus Hodarchaeales archaeon]|jgi:ribonuclease D